MVWFIFWGFGSWTWRHLQQMWQTLLNWTSTFWASQSQPWIFPALRLCPPHPLEWSLKTTSHCILPVWDALCLLLFLAGASNRLLYSGCVTAHFPYSRDLFEMATYCYSLLRLLASKIAGPSRASILFSPTGVRQLSSVRAARLKQPLLEEQRLHVHLHTHLKRLLLFSPSHICDCD